MTINDFINEYDNLSEKRKVEFLTNLMVDLVRKDVDERGDEDRMMSRIIIGDFLEVCVIEEENDYFGTEGFNG